MLPTLPLSTALHIAVVDPWFRTPDRPGSTRSYAMVCDLARAGHRVTVIATSAFADAATALPAAVTLVLVPARQSHGFGYEPAREARAQGFRAGLSHVARLRDLDAAVIVAPTTRLADGAIAACRRAEVPYIIDRREGLGPHVRGNWRQRRRVRRDLAGAVRVLAASPAIRGEAIGEGADGARVDVSPAGADLELFAGAPRDPTDFYAAHPHLARGPLVVFAGRLTAARPLGRVLELAAAMRALAPEVSFLICGDGPRRLDLNAQAARLDILERNTWFMAPRPRRELPAVLAAAHVVLAFGDDDPGAPPDASDHLFDALATGRAVAVLGGGWQRALIEERQAGVGLPAASGDAAARELLDFLGDPDMVRRAGEQAAALGRGRNATARIVADVRNLLVRAAAEHPRAGVARRKLLARKRAVDAGVALAALLILSPLWLAAAVAVAASARRWPFTAVPTIGHKARAFGRLGFAASACDGVLRRTGLDAVPGLIDVLIGRMSLVGPPPCPPDYVAAFTAEQQRRLDIRPGLTSWRGGPDQTPSTWEQVFAADVWYVDNLSLGLDAKLMAAALWRTVTGRRARDLGPLGRFDEIVARRQGAEDV